MPSCGNSKVNCVEFFPREHLSCFCGVRGRLNIIFSLFGSVSDAMQETLRRMCFASLFQQQQLSRLPALSSPALARIVSAHALDHNLSTAHRKVLSGAGCVCFITRRHKNVAHSARHDVTAADCSSRFSEKKSDGEKLTMLISFLPESAGATERNKIAKLTNQHFQKWHQTVYCKQINYSGKKCIACAN
jgi:hypothetical protein